MTDTIDFYHKWLGISPEEQPADHYRLLGIKRFESDLDVITNAADRQMRHIKTFQSGPYSDESQQVLNKLSAARVCLLNETQKAEYDEALKKLEPSTKEVLQNEPSPEESFTDEPSTGNDIEYVPTLKPRVIAHHKKSSQKWPILVTGLITGGIAGLLLFMAMQDSTDDSKYNEPTSIAATSGKDDINKPAKKKEVSRGNGLEGHKKEGVGTKQIYNARKDFSGEKNPNGVWSYGWIKKLGGNINVYPDYSIEAYAAAHNGVDIYGWRDNNLYPKVGIPFVSEQDVTTNGWKVGPDQLIMHPGFEGEYSIIRWTAPTDGKCNVKAGFAGVLHNDKAVFIYHNSEELFKDTLSSQEVAPTFKSEFIVKSGDTIDFAVGKVAYTHAAATPTACSAIIEFTLNSSTK